MAKNIIAGLDIGTSIVRLAVIENRKGESPELLALEKFPSSGIKHGYIVNMTEAIDSVQKCIDQAEKKTGIQIKNIYLGVGGISLGSTKSRGSVIISRADGEVGDHDMGRAVSIAEDNLPDIINRTIIHTNPITFKIDSQEVLGRAVGMKGKKLEVEMLFITALSQHLDDLVKCVEGAGLTVNDIVASPVAEAIVSLTKQQKDAGVLLANIGAETVSIVVFEDSMPMSLEVFPIGSSHITHDIALGMQLSLEEAEEIKLGLSVEKMQRKKLADIVEARLLDIFELIEAHLKKINRDNLLPAGIVLTGSGSKLTGLDELAKGVLRLPARIGFTLPRPRSGLRHEFTKDGFSVAYGLCIMGSNGEKETGITTRITKKTKGFLNRILRPLLP